MRPPVPSMWSTRGAKYLQPLLASVRQYPGMVVWLAGHNHHNHILYEPQNLPSNRGMKTPELPEQLRLPDNLLVVATGAAETRLSHTGHYPVGYRVWELAPGGLKTRFQPILSEGAARFVGAGLHEIGTRRAKRPKAQESVSYGKDTTMRHFLTAFLTLAACLALR